MLALSDCCEHRLGLFDEHGDVVVGASLIEVASGSGGAASAFASGTGGDMTASRGPAEACILVRSEHPTRELGDVGLNGPKQE
jgi:hypothetical protein